MRTAGYK